MSTNPYKAFIPYHCDGVRDGTHLDDHQAQDPSGGQWRHIGLVPPMKGELLSVDLQGAGMLMAVQFNERILPGKVRDEQLAKQVAKLEDSIGRKVSKKDYAQLREQVEFDLLPKAFIRRTVVPVFFTLNRSLMLVCTSSQKKADDVVLCLQGAMPAGFRVEQMQTHDDLSSRFKTLAIDGFLFDEDKEEELPFTPDNSLVLKGAGKKSVRIKDKDIEESDVQDLLKLAEYSISEIGIKYGTDADEPDLTFVANEKMVFKRLVMPDIKVTPYKEDAHGLAVLCVQTYRNMLVRFLQACGGAVPMTQPEAKPAAAAGADEDDDL